jgi:hypothetical protein
MPLRYMDVDSGLLQIAVAEKHLDSPQVGAGLQQVRGEAVAPMPSSGLCRVGLERCNNNPE